MIQFNDRNSIEDLNFRAKLAIFDAIETFNSRLEKWIEAERTIQEALDNRDAEAVRAALEKALTKLPI